ncbi:hypothetical protein KKF82_07050, partial [Patescibacteria group bacterium]|nr:hypothetical protein [Patescibacteria group bacterium]
MPKIRRYVRDVHISVTDAQYKFVAEELNGGMSHHIRNLIDAYRGYYSKELGVLEKAFPEVEANYFSMKKRIEELKEEMKRRDDDLKTRERHIEDAHEKLLEALKRALWEPGRIQRATYKIYS